MKFLEGFSRFSSAILVALTVGTASVGVEAATISVITSQSNFNVGDTFDVDFRVEGLTGAAGDSLSGFDFDVMFDETALLFSGYSFEDPVLGNQLDFIEPGSLGFDGDVQPASPGKLDVYGVSGNSDAVLDQQQADEFVFLSLTFSAIADSTSAYVGIDLADPDLLFLDSTFADLSVSYSPQSVNLVIAGSPQQVPEPPVAVLVLLSALLFGVGKPVLRKRVG